MKTNVNSVEQHNTLTAGKRFTYTQSRPSSAMWMTEPIHRLLEGAAPNERSSCTQPQPNRASAAEVTGYDGSLGTDERRSTSHTIPKIISPAEL